MNAGGKTRQKCSKQQKVQNSPNLGHAFSQALQHACVVRAEGEGRNGTTDGSRKRILHRQWQSQLLVRTNVDVRLGPQSQHACSLQYGVGGAPRHHNRRMVYCMIESDTATSCCQTDCMVLNHDPLTRPSPLMECPEIFSWKFMYRVGIVVSNRSRDVDGDVSSLGFSSMIIATRVSELPCARNCMMRPL